MTRDVPRSAPGGPGIKPRWTRGAKVGVGTAYSTSSRVWSPSIMRVYYGTLILANQRPGDPVEYPAKDIVDAGFLELVGYGIRDAHDPLIRDSLRVVDAVLKVETPFGPCWHRYNHDGFGQREAGFSIYIFLGGREPLGRERLRNRIAEPAAAERTRKAAQET